MPACPGLSPYLLLPHILSALSAPARLPSCFKSLMPFPLPEIFSFFNKRILIHLFGCARSYSWCVESSSLSHVGSFALAVESSPPTRDWTLVLSLPWECRVLATGPPGKSQPEIVFCSTPFLSSHPWLVLSHPSCPRYFSRNAHPEYGHSPAACSHGSLCILFFPAQDSSKYL